MKELEEPVLQIDPGVAQYQEIKKQHEYKLMGRMLIKPGHKLFAVNTEDLFVSIAEINIPSAQLTSRGAVIPSKRVYYDPKMYYTSALNPVNALRHYFKALYRATGHKFEVVCMHENRGVVRKVNH